MKEERLKIGYGKIPERVIKDSTLPALARVLYGLIDRYHFQNKEPSIPRLAADLSVTRQYVIELLIRLEGNGHLRTERVSGKQNRYVLLAGTRQQEFTGTRQQEFTGTPISTCREELKSFERGELKDPQPQVSRSTRSPTPLLFGEQHQHWLITGLDYMIGNHPDDPKLAAVRPWAPRLIAEFFLRQTWQANNPETGHTDVDNAFIWVKDLAAIDATEVEVAEALVFVDHHPVPNKFSRPDLRRRTLDRIKDRRRLTRQTQPQSAAVQPTRLPEWEGATDAERDAATLSARRRYPDLYERDGLTFQAACRAELRRMREAQEAVKHE